MATRYKCITKWPNYYTKTKVIRISESQLLTLQKMKSYNVDVGKFIRDAISEKIIRDASELIVKPKFVRCPF